MRPFKDEIEKLSFIFAKPTLAQSIGSWAGKGALIAAGAIGTELLAESAVDW